MPTTLLLRQAGELLQRPDHGVERVGDADDEGVRRVLLDAGADLLHDLQVDAEKVVAAHARLARHAGGDDADVGALDAGVVVGAGERGVEAFDRRRTARGRAPCPAGTPSTMSNRTMSPSSFRPARWASVPPICPAPIKAILVRAMRAISLKDDEDALIARLALSQARMNGSS